MSQLGIKVSHHHDSAHIRVIFYKSDWIFALPIPEVAGSGGRDSRHAKRPYWSRQDRGGSTMHVDVEAPKFPHEATYTTTPCVLSAYALASRTNKKEDVQIHQ